MFESPDIFWTMRKMRSITIRMTRQKLKRFHVKRIYSTLLLSYGALLAAPFIAVFLLLSFWKNSTENYYSEIMKNDLTEGRMAFEKQLDIMCAGAFSVSNDSDLKWVYFLDGLKDGDNNIAALIRCNDMLRQTFADSEHYQNYSVIMKNELIFRKSGMVVRCVQLRKHSKAREKRYSFGYAVSFIFACYQILWTFPKSRYLCSRYLPLVCG